MNGTPLTDGRQMELQRLLEERHRELRRLVGKALLKADQQTYAELAGKVRDLEEASVAGLLVDLKLAEIELHANELREVENALNRLQEGTYGICIDCQGPVGVERLQAYPMAKRCVECQAKWERTHAHPGTPTL